MADSPVTERVSVCPSIVAGFYSAEGDPAGLRHQVSPRLHLGGVQMKRNPWDAQDLFSLLSPTYLQKQTRKADAKMSWR